MKLLHQVQGGILLLVMAGIPAVAQLAICGFSPPVNDPFSISINEVLKQTQAIVWIDARPEDLYKAAHIPGALNLNQTNWDQLLPQFYRAYEPGKVVIVYCSFGCSESEEIATRIRNLGFDPVLFLEGGFETWKK